MHQVANGQYRDLEIEHWVEQKLHLERARANAFETAAPSIPKPEQTMSQEELFGKVDRFLSRIHFGPVVLGMAAGYLILHVLWALGR